MIREAIFGVAAAVAIVFAMGAGALDQLTYSRTAGHYFSSDGVPIHYVIEGEGDPVILLHGLGVNPDINFRRSGLIQALRQEFMVISMDHRGHGLSGKPHDEIAYGTEMPRDVVRLMDHLGIERAAVVGYSLGGMVTLKLTTMYPERLVCVSPNAFGYVEDLPERRDLLEGIVASLEAGDGFAPLIRGVAPPGNPPSDRRIRYVDNFLRQVNDQHAVAQLVRGFPELLLDPDELRANTVPVLTMIGTEDPLIDDVEKLGELMANIEIVHIEGRDHVTAISQEFRDRLRAFIREHYAREREDGQAPELAEAV